MKQSIQLAYRFRRVLALSIVVTGFAVLYLAARSLGVDVEIAGISDEHIRPIAHFCVYGSLAWLLAKALWGQHLLAWLIVVLLATGEEVHQLFVPYRYADIADWTINVAGITVFLLAAKLGLTRVAGRLLGAVNVRLGLGLGA